MLEAMLDKPSVRHRICPSKKDWSHVWADLDILIPTLVDCWVDNLKMKFDNVTRKTLNAIGVQIRVPGFGDTSSIEYLTTIKNPASRYFASMVDLLVDHGYQRGVTVRGAPYDFRKAPNEQEQYFKDLKKLTENTYEDNHQTKITYVAHSLGNLYLLYFLNRQPQEWKDKYVSSFVGMGGPWGGAVKAMKVIASGDDLNIPIVSRSRMGEVLRTAPSSIFLIPNEKFWPLNATLVSTPNKKYSLGNLRDFFADLDLLDGWEIYQDVKNLTQSLVPPNVKVYCVSGTGVSTPAEYIYPPGGFPTACPGIVMEDGDGTVNRRSLDACGLWATQQRQPVISRTFAGAGHRQMTRNDEVLSYLISILFPEFPEKMK
ncbi:hypothetical protein RvY_14900 [Ramazzottius varieornatus]|uniref:Group XV phospholipase A2 n=1 Tax=Ramazzottius varieornatus TaxID=947166 RepID=A0A1D1VSV4_RAMVA|nr:hypothetical protein RvY_14900 [Ramazzottius varieornatus]